MLYNKKCVLYNFMEDLWKKQENHISYKPFGGCFEDENDSQYNLTNQTENKQKQTTDKKE